MSTQTSERLPSLELDDTQPLIPTAEHYKLIGESDVVDWTRPEFNLTPEQLEALALRIEHLETTYRSMPPSPERDRQEHDIEMLKFAYINGQRGRYIQEQRARKMRKPSVLKQLTELCMSFRP